MTRDQIQEVELLYKKLGIPKDIPVRTTLVTHKVNGHFATRSTVSKGKTSLNCNSQDLKK